MLTFVGLGLYDETSITREGATAVASADRVYLEAYTSVLPGAHPDALEAAHDVDIEVLGREAIERHPDRLLDAAETDQVALLVGGDPMIATTHVDLRLRAHDRGIETRIVHGTSAATAAAGLTGLQQYRFGQATTLPFPDNAPGGPVPPSVLDVIEANTDRGLHTLVFLDLSLDDVDRQVLASELPDRCLDAATAAELLAQELDDRLAVAVARAGSRSPRVIADTLGGLANRSFGPPLHLLVLPGNLHDMEREALTAFAEGSSAAIERH